jgi:hypothetical protein
VSRSQLLLLIRVTLAAAAVIVVLGVLAVGFGVFDPSRSERARGYVEREYGAELGDCRELAGERLECEIEESTPELRRAVGRGRGDRICVFVFENASVVLDGYAPCRRD